MPLAVACPKCKKQYNLPDKFLGKPVKCTECATQFKVPAGKGQPASSAKPGAGAAANPRAAANQQAAAKRRQAQAAAQQKAKELQQLGVDGPIRRSPDVFDGLGQAKGTPDPLANHLIEDPGFGETTVKRETSDINETADPMAGMFENPALQAPKKKRKAGKGKKKSGAAAWYLDPMTFTLAVMVPLGIVVAVIAGTKILPSGICFAIACIGFALVYLASFANFIWACILVYQETESVLQVLLTVFIPAFILWPIVKYWSTMRQIVFTGLALLIATIAWGVALGFSLANKIPIEEVAQLVL